MTVRAAESWICRLNYTNHTPWRTRGTAASINVVKVPHPPLYQWPNLSSSLEQSSLSRVATSTSKPCCVTTAYSPTSWSEITAQRQLNFVDDDRTKCTRLLALRVAAIGDFKAIVKPFLAFLISYFAVPRRMSLQGQFLDNDCDQSACAIGCDAMQLFDHAYC